MADTDSQRDATSPRVSDPRNETHSTPRSAQAHKARIREAADRLLKNHAEALARLADR
ncbi:MAG: hypothetical protein NVS4B3_23010 [Gemmatimonadaceae bacterium]